jgi:hypothetical protein
MTALLHEISLAGPPRAVLPMATITTKNNDISKRNCIFSNLQTSTNLLEQNCWQDVVDRARRRARFEDGYVLKKNATTNQRNHWSSARKANHACKHWLAFGDMHRLDWLRGGRHHCKPLAIRASVASMEIGYVAYKLLESTICWHGQYAPHKSDHSSSMAMLWPARLAVPLENFLTQARMQCVAKHNATCKDQHNPQEACTSVHSQAWPTHRDKPSGNHACNLATRRTALNETLRNPENLLLHGK